MDKFQSFSSIVANTTIAYFFASRLKISQIIAITLSIATFTTILLLKNPTADIVLPYGFDFKTLINPIVSTYFLKLFYPKFSLKISLTDGHHHVYRLFNYVFVFLFAYIATIGLYIITSHLTDIAILYINKIHLNLPNIIILAIRDLFVEISWFFGLHGSHVVNAIMGKDILFEEMLPNLTYGEFNRLFVLIGGAGIGLGLLISLLLYAKNSTIRFITKLSAPFVVFNINTLLIYAVVVLSRYYILPFILLPIANLFIAFIAIHFIDVHFTHYYLTWMTPIFADSVLKVHEYYKTISLQIFLIVFDTLVYIYFTKKFISSQSPMNHFDILVKNLEITDEIKAEESLKSFVKRQEIIEANAEVDKIIESINNHDLYVFYQPKVSTKTETCLKYEALIRHYHDGKLTGPIFLDTLEKAGLAPIIDIYVCKKVKNALNSWKNKNFFPQISINLHPDTLKSKSTIDKIVQILDKENITFEIIERSFLDKAAEINLIKLQKNSFKISIDDFGAGYSSFETLAKYTIDELKIDKSLIDIISEKKGYLICKNTTKLCHEIDCLVVAEGVETEEQVDIVKKIGVDYIQGFYYSKAIPFDEIISFSKSQTS